MPYLAVFARSASCVNKVTDASAATKSGKRIAIVQSSYIPWRGYFDLVHSVDEFILFDDVQYTRRDWRNRNRIKAPNGLIWLTVPIEIKGNYLQHIKDAVVSDEQWNIRHWKTIVHCYSRARYFADYREVFEELYLNSHERYLSLINFKFLTRISALLGVKTRFTWSSDYELREGKTERLVHLCKQAGASEYLSGPTARAYLNEDIFEREGISVCYADYSGYRKYRQLYPPFHSAVSIIDLIFNEGPFARSFMKSF